MKFVRKRDGRLEPFNQERITNAIWSAAKAVGGKDRELAKRLSDQVVAELKKRFGEDGVPTVEEIQDVVEKVLIENGHARTAKAYILYRKQHQDLRELAALLSSADLVDQYLEAADWRVKENSNMSYSLQGLNNYLSSTVVAKYWITRIYPPNIAEAHHSGDFHIHDLGVLGAYCIGWDLRDLLISGFGGVQGKVESAPAKHFRSALGQVVNFFYTLQGECYSQDTQVLTDSGWKYFYEVKEDDKIFTLNLKTNEIELQRPVRFYEFWHEGELYNFKSKRLDLLVTANHNMLVDQYCPDCKERYSRRFIKAMDLDPNKHLIPKQAIWKGRREEWFILPEIEAQQHQNSSKKYEAAKIAPKKIPMEDWLQFFGFWLAKGSISLRKRGGNGGNGSRYEYQVRISQDKGEKADEFERILERLPFHYVKKDFGRKIEFIIYDKQLLSYLMQFGNEEERFIPKGIKDLDATQLLTLLNWVIKGNGYAGNGNVECYIKSKKLVDDIQELALKSGLSADVYGKRKGDSQWYKISISRRGHFTVSERGIRKVNYRGRVYCLEVPNHVMYVRRNGKACWCGNSAGAQAFSNFDVLLSPFIRYDNLSQRDVEQALQEFFFNMNVPTRVGFQCLSEDTEILTPDGWKSYDQVKVGDVIYTFNLRTHELELKPVNGIFVRKYKGKMYNLRNRAQDQLISPRHRIVRRVFNSNKYKLEQIEDVLTLRSPILIPVTGVNVNSDVDVSDEQLKLMAWLLSEGSVKGKGNRRISIYRSKNANPEKYEEIADLLGRLNLEFEVGGRGGAYHCIKLSPTSSNVIHGWFKGVNKAFPKWLYRLSRRQARVFLETYIKGSNCGEERRKEIVATRVDILEGLEALAVLAGYNFSVKKVAKASARPQYYLILTESRHDYIQEIKEVDYEGVIWSVHNDNETVIAKRNGKPFITGNTPFTNVTLDMKVPDFMKDEPVVIGGKFMDDTYGDMQDEVDMFNVAFAEIMCKGDAKGRVFTFPIPTYNITKDFDWESLASQKVFEASAKYGAPYFSNFVNSDMKPEDVRSMCCRLRIDNRELLRRGGGYFGASPLTGSIGVVTINMPRIGYLSKDEDEFFERLSSIMELAKDSLEIKRKILENFTEKGLYPYSRRYLRRVKDSVGKYWRNHFSTIGLVGMNEAIMNMFGYGIASPDGLNFAIKVLEFMRSKLVEFQEGSGNMYNLEATPAEGASYRLARIDKKKYPNIIVANEKYLSNGAEPFYTNSSQLPVDYEGDLFDALEHQDKLQTLYTGGTVFHIYLGERLYSWKAVAELIKKVTWNFRLPYLTLTPTFSICPTHGYVSGEHVKCPTCGAGCEVYSRVVGYLRPVDQWNDGKRAEFAVRKTFDKSAFLTAVAAR